MKNRSRMALLQFALTIAFIMLGASLHGSGQVGFWGMFVIMMVPNMAFALLRYFRRRPAV